MIDDIYRVVQVILNKEQSGGYVSPSQYNDIAKQAQEEIHRSYIEDLNRDQNKENRGFSGQGFISLTDTQIQRLEPFMKSATLSQAAGVYTLPADLSFLEQDTVLTDVGRVVDRIKTNQRGYVANSIAKPSVVYPVFYVEGSSLTVLPSTYLADISISYLKKPTNPQWAYTILGNGDPVYNEANSTDFELHPSEFSNIVLKILTYFGITLREGEVIQVAESLKGQQLQRDES